MLVFVMQSSWS